MRFPTRLLVTLGVTGLISCSTPRPASPPQEGAPEIRLAAPQTPAERARSEAAGRSFAISTQGRAASQAAREMYGLGGNAIDAAIAASFTISVERPQSTGLGGGGFLLFREGRSGKVYAADFRERAPRRATRDMFLDAHGEVVPNRSTEGIFSVATPGLVAGLLEVHQRFGRLPLAKVMAPAIRLAEEGFEIYPTLARALAKKRELLARFPSSRAIFLEAQGEPRREGARLVQKDLAETLRRIVRGGRAEFYRGRTARAIVRESKRLGGLLDSADLRAYRVKWREPLAVNARGYRMYAMPPPSSGGTHVLEILAALDAAGQPPRRALRGLGFQSADAITREANAMQLAFADRARYMGDPDFVQVPADELVSAAYAHRQGTRVPDDRALRGDEVAPGPVSGGREESPQTTHFSIVDASGDMVASTQTVNDLMGSGVVATGTGIVLNDEMDDFAAKPGAANVFGAIGGEANAVAPGKTPLSSMAPTLVLRPGPAPADETPVLAVGAPGGTRIITCVAQTILNYLDFGLPLYESVAAIRFHHQWKPEVLQFDSPGPPSGVREALERRGFRVEVEPDAVICRVMAVAREGAVLHGVADPRDVGTSLAE